MYVFPLHIAPSIANTECRMPRRELLIVMCDVRRVERGSVFKLKLYLYEESSSKERRPNYTFTYLE
jgi:hypothetical protein